MTYPVSTGRREVGPGPPTAWLVGAVAVAATTDLLVVWGVARAGWSEPAGSLVGLVAAGTSAVGVVRAGGGRLACLPGAVLSFLCLVVAPGVAAREGVVPALWVMATGSVVALASVATLVRLERRRPGPLTVLWSGPRTARRARRHPDGTRGPALWRRAMPLRSRVPEIGEPRGRHRPVPLVAGVAILLAITAPLPVWFAIGPPGPWVGLAMFVVFLACFGYGLGEWFLLEHRLYEHALVLRSSLPGLKTFVVPLYTIDPDDLEIGGRRLHDGGVAAALDRRFRQCPLISTTIRFDGLDPDRAHGLAVGRLGWFDAGVPTIGIRGDDRRLLAPRVRWMVSYRHPQHHLEAIRATVVASRATLPPDVAQVVTDHHTRAPTPDLAVDPDQRQRPLGPGWLP